MTDVISPATVEREILRLVRKQEELTDDLAGIAREKARTEAVHKSSYAKAFLAAEGNMSIREHTATVEVDAAYKARLYSEAVYQSQKEALLTCRSQLDSLRTIAANIRSQT